MPGKLCAKDVLDREFLVVRSRLLDIAASLDRIDLAAGASGVAGDERLSRIHEGLSVLREAGAGRAERLHMVFSEPYGANWRAGS